MSGHSSFEEREIAVAASRMSAWLAGFGRRNGAPDITENALGWLLTAHDGSQAQVARPDWAPADLADPSELGAEAEHLVYGVLIIRRAGYLVARVRGGLVDEAKVGSRHIHGRTAAGGWSQKRYARRRANQADEIAEAVAGHSRAILGAHELAFLCTGGDRPLLSAVMRAEPRLQRIAAGPSLAVGTPDSRLLRKLPEMVCSVKIATREPRH
ncbi:MAG: acVLRF1 family peptidyl-tRNA hydrolase [Candidatus Nanopelagicales bacterium]